MNYFSNIAGNTTLTQRLSQDISSGALSHAYIIEGRRGSGRHLMALSAAAAISCRDANEAPCQKCINCRKIFEDRSPDVIRIGLDDDKKAIGVDAVRRIKSDISTAPNDLDIKVYVIDDADTMTQQAQNALLLSLEEPPEYILFFLICENSSSLLETVRSRAPILRTERLSSEKVEEYVLAHDKRAAQLKSEKPDEFATVIFVADGCIGTALDLLDSRTRKKLIDSRLVASKIISMLSKKSSTEAFELITSLGNKRADVADKLSQVRYALRDLILLKKYDDVALCYFEDRDTAAELSTRFTATSLLALYDATETALDDLEKSANVRLTLMNMMQSAGLI